MATPNRTYPYFQKGHVDARGVGAFRPAVLGPWAITAGEGDFSPVVDFFEIEFPGSGWSNVFKVGFGDLRSWFPPGVLVRLVHDDGTDSFSVVTASVLDGSYTRVTTHAEVVAKASQGADRTTVDAEVLVGVTPPWNGMVGLLDAELGVLQRAVEEIASRRVALQLRLNAVFTDEGVDSQLAQPVPEFRAFSIGIQAHSQSNTPVHDGGSPPTSFAVAFDYRDRFALYQALRFKRGGGLADTYGYVTQVDYAASTTTVHFAAGPLATGEPALVDVELSTILSGMPALAPERVRDASLPLAKLGTALPTRATYVTVIGLVTANFAAVLSPFTNAKNTFTNHQEVGFSQHGAPAGSPLCSTAFATAAVASHNTYEEAHRDPGGAFVGVQSRSERGQPNGYVALDGSGEVDTATQANALIGPFGIKSVFQTDFGSMGDGVVLSVLNYGGQATWDPAKAVIFTGGNIAETAETEAARHVTLEVTGPSQVTLTRENSDGDARVAFTVVEFY